MDTPPSPAPSRRADSPPGDAVAPAAGSDSPPASPERPPRAGATGAPALLLRALFPILLLAIGATGYVFLSVEPAEEKRPPRKKRPVRTKVVELHRADHRPVVTTQGVVRPHDEVTLTAQVPGRIVRLTPGFEDGAFFAEGDVLLELDRADYLTAVVVAEAALARAQTAFLQEEIRAKQALLNWNDLGYEEKPNELVLRKPQLREAEANVAAAQAQLERAQRELEQTRVRAPFDGRVRQRLVGLGQSIGGTTPLGMVFSVDTAEIRLPIQPGDLKFIRLPEVPGDPPVPVELRDALAEDEEDPTVWRAEIVRTEGVVDASSLELFAIARIDDPFGRRSGHPPLRVGQPVVATLFGHLLEDVVVIPREAVRQLDRIYLIEPDTLTLRHRAITPLWTEEEVVVVRDPEITDGALLAKSYLSYAPEGAVVEILPESGAEMTAAGAGPGAGKSAAGSSAN